MRDTSPSGFSMQATSLIRLEDTHCHHQAKLLTSMKYDSEAWLQTGCIPVVIGGVGLQPGQLHMVHAARNVDGVGIDLLIRYTLTHCNHAQIATLTSICHLPHSLN